MTQTECQFPAVSALSGYEYGCRCDRCKRGYAEWRKSWRKRHRAWYRRKREELVK